MNQKPPMSSQEYLQKLRQQRLQKQTTSITQPTTAPTQAQPVAQKEKTLTDQPNKKEVKEKDEKNERFPGVPKPRPKRTLMSWQAPSRPFKERDAQYYFTVVAIVFLISLILFFAGQFLSIAVVISVGFLAYVLSSVPPHQVENQISTYGIKIADELYYWEEMGRFWFEKKYDQEILLIEIGRFPGRIVLLFEPKQKKDLQELLSEVLLQEKPADTFYDKAAVWLKEKVPLDITS